MIEKERLLSHLEGEERRYASRLLDQVEVSLKRAEPVATDFLDPREMEIFEEILHYLPEVKTLKFGGYRQAERARMVIMPSFYLMESVEPPLTYLSIRPLNGGAKKANDPLKGLPFSHRDLLGSILGLGIKREKVGDFLLTDEEAQLVVAEEIGDFLLTHLNKVGSTLVEIKSIDPEQLNTPIEKIKEIKSTVASLRLDAVAGAGYGMSRTKVVREIKAEKVKVNWRPVTNPAYKVKAGDVLSIRGRGRVIIAEAGGVTKKGRIRIVLKRLL
jgi:RNA-binding protein YlmH